MKIYVITLNKRDFENLTKDKETKGYSYFEISPKKHLIFLKYSKSRTILKGTLEHELSHIFIREFRIKRIIDRSEFKRVLKDKKFRNYDKKIYNTSFKLREEFLADFVGCAFFGDKYERNYIKKNYPKNYKIIQKKFKKFKPKLIYI